MSKSRVVALNGNAGAFTSISATMICRYVEIREDEAAAPTGLQYKLPDDNFTQIYTVGTHPVDGEPQIVLGDKLSQGKGHSPLLGGPAQNMPGGVTPTTATVLIQLRGNAVGVTSVRVTEFD